MGHNATIVIHLDALDAIKNDPDFGKNLAAAIEKKANYLPQGDKTIIFNTSAERYTGTAGVVIEVHNANQTLQLEVGHNTGRIKPFKK